MKNDIGNYARHAKFWDWGGYDRTAEHDYWLNYADKYGKNVLIPMCAIGETAAYMARRGFHVTAFDITPEMIAEGKRRFGDVPSLRMVEGDIRDIRLDMPPADFCYLVDLGHIHELEEIKRALACINTHLRDGGCLVIKTGLRSPGDTSFCTPTETFYPLSQVYPNMKVWKTGITRNDAETGRCTISQTFYAEHENGHVDQFGHAFYLQNYFREEWLSAFAECGFVVAREEDDGGYHLFELAKDAQ